MYGTGADATWLGQTLMVPGDALADGTGPAGPERPRTSGRSGREADELWDDESYPRRWPTGMRVVALVALVAFVLVYALSFR